jgi:hypothetical protein
MTAVPGQIRDAPTESQYSQMDKRKTGFNGILHLDFRLIILPINGRDFCLSSSANRLKSIMDAQNRD